MKNKAEYEWLLLDAIRTCKSTLKRVNEEISNINDEISLLDRESKHFMRKYKVLSMYLKEAEKEMVDTERGLAKYKALLADFRRNN